MAGFFRRAKVIRFSADPNEGFDHRADGLTCAVHRRAVQGGDGVDCASVYARGPIRSGTIRLGFGFRDEIGGRQRG
jgi:hypothetical protein